MKIKIKSYLTKIFAIVFAVYLVMFSFFACTTVKNKNDGQKESEVLEVHFLDVGQGDCELIITPSGETMLIDASITEMGETVVAYISALGIEEIDVFVATHYHEDHIGGSVDVFDAFDVQSVLILDCEVTTSCAKRLKASIEKEGSEIIYAERGYEFSLGEAEFLTLSPEKITDNGGNDDSIVLRMEYKEARYIFTGDAEKKTEKGIVDYYGEHELSADLLKVGHHGSSTSTTQEFLNAVAPSVAVISCGKGNSYGHPHSETLEKLSKKVKYIYRTDIVGAVVIVTDGKSIYLSK